MNQGQLFFRMGNFGYLIKILLLHGVVIKRHMFDCVINLHKACFLHFCRIYINAAIYMIFKDIFCRQAGILRNL